jgi:nucleotide-binding universal stress UspA family protein
VISVPVFATPQMETGYLDTMAWTEIRDNAVNDANRAIEQTLAHFKGAGLACEATVPSGLEGPKAAILDEAERWQADLIVVGSHSHGRLDRFLLGSVSETLALYASCSVEVFREKQVQLEKNDRRAEASYIRVVPMLSGGA